MIPYSGKAQHQCSAGCGIVLPQEGRRKRRDRAQWARLRSGAIEGVYRTSKGRSRVIEEQTFGQSVDPGVGNGFADRPMELP